MKYVKYICILTIFILVHIFIYKIIHIIKYSIDSELHNIVNHAICTHTKYKNIFNSFSLKNKIIEVFGYHLEKYVSYLLINYQNKSFSAFMMDIVNLNILSINNLDGILNYNINIIPTINSFIQTYINYIYK